MDNLPENIFDFICNNIIIAQKSEKLTSNEFIFEANENKFRIKFDPQEKTISLCRYTTDFWKQLSVWSFDEENIKKSDVNMILNDFNQILDSRKKSSSHRTEEKNKKTVSTDGLMFLINRIATFIPEIRSEIKLEKENSENFRFVHFLNVQVIPRIKKFLEECDEKTKFKFFKNLSEQYSSGNLNVRCFVTMGVLNSLDFAKYEKFSPNDEFKNIWKQSLKYKE